MTLTEAYATTAYLVMAYIHGSIKVADHDKLNIQLLTHNMMAARNGVPTDNFRMLFSVLLDLQWGYSKVGMNIVSCDRMLLVHTKKVVGHTLDVISNVVQESGSTVTDGWRA